jgi:hypothetical protein
MCKNLGAGGRKEEVGRVQERETCTVMSGNRPRPDHRSLTLVVPDRGTIGWSAIARSSTAGCWAGGDQWSPAGHRMQSVQIVPDPLTCKFLAFKKKLVPSFFMFFYRPLYVARAWASWEGGGCVCTVPPFFEACSYTWECEIFHSSWSFEISFL